MSSKTKLTTPRKPRRKKVQPPQAFELSPLAPSPEPAAKPKHKRIAVFIDENELVRASQSGVEFDLDRILEKVRGRISGQLVRVFLYVSYKTEAYMPMEIRSFFLRERSDVRYIKTGNQPNEVDRRMREDLSLWSEYRIADVFVLGTADGGQDFQSAIAEIKSRGQEMILLETAGVFNSRLSQMADHRINATPKNENQGRFNKTVMRARCGYIDQGSRHGKFVIAVAGELSNFFARHPDSGFLRILNWIWDRLAPDWQPRGFVLDDAKAALSSLIHEGHALEWDRIPSGGKRYRLNQRRHGNVMMSLAFQLKT